MVRPYLIVTGQLELNLGIARPSIVGVAASRFNVFMLSLAREAKGLTQREVAKSMGCKQSRVSKIESGELTPQESDVQHFVRIFDQERSFFYRNAAPMPASVSFYRKTQAFPLRVLRQCNAQMNVRRLQIETLIGAKKLGSRDLPYLPPSSLLN